MAFAALVSALAALLAPSAPWSSQLGAWASGVGPPSLAAATAALAAAFAAALFLARRPVPPWTLAAALLAGQALALRAAWPSVAGAMPWGVDHGAFQFRLLEFRSVFPAVGSYNPWWNGGIEHFVGVTSGAHAFGLLNLPLLAAADPPAWYGPALAFWLFAGLPWLSALALRATGVRWAGALAGALAMAAFTRAEFLFFWQSGNLGGMVTAGLSLPLAAFGYRLAVLRRGGRAGALALALLAWLSCIWPPGAFTCAGLFLGWLANPGRWTRRSFLRLVAAGALALLLLSPWFWAEFLPMRGISRYATRTPEPGSLAAMAADGVRLLGLRLLEWHPAILGFGLAGLLAASHRRMRRFLLPALALLFAVAVSVGIKRQSQLDRVAIQAASFAAFPAAILLGRLFARDPRRLPVARRAGLAAAQGVALSLLAIGALRVAPAHAANRAGFKLWPAEPVVFEFADWVRANVPEGGRLAFSGETDCKLDWGKGTYLPVLAGREMMSDDYYGYPKGLTERNYPPKFYRRSTEAFLFFSRAYGITHWAVTDPRTRRFCEEETEHFRLAARFPMQSTDVRVYEITDPGAAAPTRFLEGDGEVEARESRIAVRPADPAAERLVLRYNWRDGLVCRTPGATIEPFEVDGNLRFVAVRPNGAPRVEIGYRPLWRPLPPNFDGRFHH